MQDCKQGQHVQEVVDLHAYALAEASVCSRGMQESHASMRAYVLLLLHTHSGQQCPYRSRIVAQPIVQLHVRDCAVVEHVQHPCLVFRVCASMP